VSDSRGLLAIDQGTTSTRAILFGLDGSPRAVAQRELPQSFPQDGWVEHDPERIAADAELVARQALARAGMKAADLLAAGITNQRETVVLWERATGRPIHPAIVWQDRRTADECARLREVGHEAEITLRTGLLLDPYFSATKIAWILDHVPGARARAERGELAAGTVDSWLTWRLTRGAAHLTDASNAARTLLFDLREQKWSPELCALLRVPVELLPAVRDTASDFGSLHPDALGAAVPLRALVGDQQAAAFGQGCLTAGAMKATYGTGCFTIQNTGAEMLTSSHRLLSTVAWRLNGRTTFALEGSIFHAGTVVQWLRDGLGLLRESSDAEARARAADPRKRVYLVPAFTGLGAPWWQPNARGAIHGLTRDVGGDDLVRAGLEAACFQTRDLLEAAVADGAKLPQELRVDGGMVRNDWLLQSLADLTGLPVARPVVNECTALGAALLAAVGAGALAADSAAAIWRPEKRCEPQMSQEERDERFVGWQTAVRRTLQDA
jgi:glycerol kinase